MLLYLVGFFIIANLSSKQEIVSMQSLLHENWFYFSLQRWLLYMIVLLIWPKLIVYKLAQKQKSMNAQQCNYNNHIYRYRLLLWFIIIEILIFSS